MLREELKIANEQYKELSVALEQQQSQFSSLQVSVLTLFSYY